MDNSNRTVYGIDIGTGASAIYPLLACSMEKSWKFIASEIDELSYSTAKENISINKLDNSIQLLKSDQASPILLPLFHDKYTAFDFTMCNPPFYSSAQDVAQSAEAKQFGPNAVCTGAEVEMITEGGESAFVGKMITESLNIRERCRWYTSMLGKLTSVAQVVDTLKSHSIDNYIITEFVQGQTRRWAVGWSFSDVRLPDSVSRIPNHNPALKCLPPHNTILQPIFSISKEHLREALSGILSSIDNITIRSHNAAKLNERSEPGLEPEFEFLVSAQQDTWSRSARRRQKRVIPDLASNSVVPPSIVSSIAASEALVCSINTRQLDTDLEIGKVTAMKRNSPSMVMKRQNYVVGFLWRKGRDRGLFESFCSHVSQKLIRAQ